MRLLLRKVRATITTRSTTNAGTSLGIGLGIHTTARQTGTCGSTLNPTRIRQIRQPLTPLQISLSTLRKVTGNRNTSTTRKQSRMASSTQDVAAILAGKYPAKAHVKRVLEYMKSKGTPIDGVIYLEGQKERLVEDNDSPMHFRQRRFFYYLTGCNLSDSSYTYDIAADKSTLYIPGVDPESVMWSGLPLSEDEALKLYDVDTVLTTEKVNSVLAAAKGGKVWAIAKPDSANVVFPTSSNNDLTLLKEAIEECRVVKDSYEVALTKHANSITNIAQQAVMKAVKHAKHEGQLEGLFLERCISHGAKEQAYHAIVASGTAAATLHYVKNYEPLEGKLNLLLDAGAEYECYASDVVSFIPISSSPPLRS